MSKLESWNAIASQYADYVWGGKETQYTQTVDYCLRLAHITPNMQILDLACGPGYLTDKVASKLDGGSVTGVDFSPAIVEIAQSRVGHPNTQFICSPAENVANIGLKDIDVVFCNAAVWKFDIPVTLAGLRTVMVQDGRFIFNINPGYYQFENGEKPSPVPIRERLKQSLIERGVERPPKLKTVRGKFTLLEISKTLANYGFNLIDAPILLFTVSSSEYLDFLTIGYGLSPFSDVDPQILKEVVEQERRRMDPNEKHDSKWPFFVAVKIQ